MNNKDLPLYFDEDLQENVYKCRYTDKLVKESEVILVGPILPNINWKHACAEGFQEIRKESIRLFNESEQNYNTCINLERIKHKKNNIGLLYGKCTKNNVVKFNHPYKHTLNSDGEFAFPPSDYLGMECYEPRTK